MTTEFIDEVCTILDEHNVFFERHKSIALSTTYGVGGSAAVVVPVNTIESTCVAAKALSLCPVVPVVVVGRGSNTLFADGEFDGVVVLIGSSDESRMFSVDDHVLRAPASMLMPVLARRSVQSGFSGLEWCVGIPGTVGGAVRMNAGGHGAEIVDSLVDADIVSLRSGRCVTVPANDLGLHFRGSALSAHHVVLSAQFRVAPSETPGNMSLIDDIVAWRRANQPGGRNAGSVFVNPAPGDGSAGALIDQCGLRGFSIGGAHVSEKHANFIQASEDASATDIVGVMSHVQDVVRQEMGIVLRSEIRLVGFSPDITTRFSDSLHEDAERLRTRDNLCRMLGESDG